MSRFTSGTSALAAILKATGNASVVGVAAGIFAAEISIMLSKQESWWKDSFAKILDDKIKYVRYTIVENPKDYPKIWRVLERISK